MSTKQNYAVTVTVGDRSLGIYDKFTGGEVSAETNKYRPGALGQQVALTGPAMTGDVTVTRLFDRQRDADLIRWLFTVAGRASMIVSKQPLDNEGIPFGRPHVYSGLFATITPGDVDSESSDADLYDLVLSTEGTPA